MRRSLAATLVALSLALTMAPAVVSAADEGKARATAPDASLARTAATTDSERATAALARAKALFGGTKSGEGRNGGAGGKSGKHRDATIGDARPVRLARRPVPGRPEGRPRHPRATHRRRERPVQRRLPRAVGEEVQGQLLHALGHHDRGRAPEPDLGQPDAQADEQGLEEGSQEVRLPSAGLRREPRRQRQVRRVPRPDRRRGPLRVLRPRAPQARLPVAGVRLLRPRQRLRRVPPRPDGQREGDRCPRVLPRHPVRLRLRRGRLAARGHRHLDGGARLRRGQRQPSVPPGRPGLRPDVPARLLQLPGQSAVRQLAVLRVPQQELRQRRGQGDLEQGGRVPRRPGPLLDQGDQPPC